MLLPSFLPALLLVSSLAMKPESGTVMTLSNDPAGNAVLVAEYDHGTFTLVDTVFTGGIGTGGGLGSQAALARSDDHRYVLAVNPGSDDVTLFRRRGGELEWLDLAPTGVRPTSVAVHGPCVQVLNAGDDTLSGFRIERERLVAVSTTPLDASGVAAAQVGFDPKGDHVVVTERATNRILVFPVARDGSLGSPTANASNSPTPFGFVFREDGVLVVSEAVGGAAGASTCSSYRIGAGGVLDTVSGAVPDQNTAACWIAIPRNGRFAYTTNAGTGNISGFALDRRGHLALLDPTGVSGDLGAGSAPIDFDFRDDGQLLFTLDAGHDAIVVFRRDRDGSLELLDGSLPLADGAAGLLAN